MIYGNKNGFVYEAEEMDELIDCGVFKADDFYPITTMYEIWERENFGIWVNTCAKFCTREQVERSVQRKIRADAVDREEELVPYGYSCQYEVREVTL